jgi:predicted dehydrogenase
MRIGLLGAGQMGGYYANNLVNKCRYLAADIVVFDRIRDRAEALRQKFGITAVDSLPADIDAAIVATNTPSHDELIVRLAQQGVKHILCEKPLAQTPTGVDHILKNVGDTQVYTALVINFSQTLRFLLHDMAVRNIALLDCYGRWGKNRGAAAEKRPTVGDLEDEAIHPIAFFLALAQEGYSEAVVSAQVGWLPYVNEEGQKAARDLDPSFPKQPNHSTSVNLRLRGSKGELKANIYSSFLHPQETRSVGGLLGRRGDVRFAFECNFDQKRPEKTGGAVDTVKWLNVKTNEGRTYEFETDKLNELTEAFLRAATFEKVDRRLVKVKEAAALVDLSAAMLKSDELDGAPTIVKLR